MKRKFSASVWREGDWYVAQCLDVDESELQAKVAQLLDRPYVMLIRGDSREGYLATAPELPGCVTAGETEAEALVLLRDAMAGWFEAAVDHGLPIPEPSTAPLSDLVPSKRSGG